MKWTGIALIIGMSFFIAHCSPESEGEFDYLAQQSAQQKLTKKQKDFIERFNAVAKDIRDGKANFSNVDKYFYVFKSVTNIEDADYIFIGENHTHPASQVWSASFANATLTSKDIMFFEGATAGVQINDVTRFILMDIFATREYEKYKSIKDYKSDAIFRIKQKNTILFKQTKPFLALNAVRFNIATGYFWDIKGGGSSFDRLVARNKTMVLTIDKINPPHGGKSVIYTGAAHLPFYEFAFCIAKLKANPTSRNAFLATPGANLTTINDVFYDYFYPRKISGSSRPIWEFIKSKRYAMLFPKNMPHSEIFEP